MRISLLALDLDGTLLPPSKVLPARSRTAVRAAADAGVTVVLATGKTFHLAGRYADEIGIRGPLIALDGSEVRRWPSGEALFLETIDAGRTARALRAVAGLDLHLFLADGGDRLLLSEALADRREFFRVYSERIDLSPHPARDRRGDPRFLAFLGSASAVRVGEAALGAALDGRLRVFTAHFPGRGISLLVARPRRGKGSALASLAERLGIPRGEVAAVGDWKNDVGMIAWAGTGVAMADAHPSAVEVADVVLPGGADSPALAAWLAGAVRPVAGPGKA